MKGQALLPALLACLAATSARSDSLPHAEAAARADAALVLSGDVDYLRLGRAIELFHAKAVPKLLLTGAGVGGDSALAMREIARKRDVPDAAILLETRSRTTYENLAFAAPLIRAQGFKRVLLVTSASHMERASRTARKALPEITWLLEPVPDAGSPERQAAERRQEWLKLVYYAWKGWI